MLIFKIDLHFISTNKEYNNEATEDMYNETYNFLVIN